MKPTLVAMLEARWFNTGQTFAGEHIYRHPIMTDKIWLYNPMFESGVVLDVPENKMQHKDINAQKCYEQDRRIIASRRCGESYGA